ncbi:MAG: hypothetical protein WBP64_09920 [Nitrososphaeraceae archaeon]
MISPIRICNGFIVGVAKPSILALSSVELRKTSSHRGVVNAIKAERMIIIVAAKGISVS